MRQEALRSGYGWLGLAVFVVCVQSYKKDSPSSGLLRVKVYNEHGMAQRNGTGMFPREVVPMPPRGIGQTHSRFCRWRRKAGSTTCPCVRISSSGCLAYGGKDGFPLGSSAAGKLHDRMDGKLTVTLDALHCQMESMEATLEKRADYVLPVKENQLRLLEALQRLYDDPEEMRWVECYSYRTIEKGSTPPPLPVILSTMAANHRQGAYGPS